MKKVPFKKILQFISKYIEKGSTGRLEVSMVPMILNDPQVVNFWIYWINMVHAVNIYSYLNEHGTIMDEEALEGLGERSFFCLFPWKDPVITVDGNVLPCCYAFNSKASMGNVFEMSFEKIWNGERFMRFRENILKGDYSDFPNCQKCSKWVHFPPVFKKVGFWYIQLL